MAFESEHAADCVQILGEGFPEVHRWLDELFVTLGPNHRWIRHHVGGIEEVRRKWGDRAADAARIHIERDFGGWVPTEGEAQAYAIHTGVQHAFKQEQRPVPK